MWESMLEKVLRNIWLNSNSNGHAYKGNLFQLHQLLSDCMTEA